MSTHINPAVSMYRQPRPLYDYFNAPRRAGYNPAWEEPGDPAGHKGVDLYAAGGTSAIASEAGQVHFAGRKLLSNPAAGLYVEIWHPQSKEISRYLHLSDVRVVTGQWVNQGDRIGDVGCTGQCSSPHIHYALKRVSSYDPGRSGSAMPGVWLDPILEGILVNQPGPVPPLEPFAVTRPPVVKFSAPYATDPNVQDLQALLARRGFLSWAGNNEGGVFDGKAGPLTEEAVEDFQFDAGLPVTGIVDNGTWQALLVYP